MNSAPFSYYGGKYRLLPILQQYVPRDIDCYVEPFFGSGTLFFSAPRWAENEVINDLNGDVYNFFHVLRNNYPKLKHAIKYTPYDIQTFLHARDIIKNHAKLEPVLRAWALYVLLQQSIMSNRRSFSRGTIDDNKPAEFERSKSHLEYCSVRLRNATIENDQALKICRRYDNQRTFIYLDPPYLNVRNKADMEASYHIDKKQSGTMEQMHLELLEWALQAQGYVLISNYHNPLYDDLLKNWHTQEIIQSVVPGGQRGKNKQINATEVLWSNEKCWRAKIHQPGFDW